MPQPNTDEGTPIGVGLVGTVPREEEGLLARLPEGRKFRLVSFSNEGAAEPGPPAYQPARYHSDYNTLLRDSAVELVLVDAPLELRRDLATRALNAGRHVVLPLPFAETALGAERVMKTAHKQGLVATADCPWRDNPDLHALRFALQAAPVGPPLGITLFAAVEPEPEPQTSLVDLLFLEETEDEETTAPQGLLGREGLALLDQLHCVADDYVKNVTAHVLVRTPPERQEGFMVYLSLRGGGWAVAQASTALAPDVPRWVVHGPLGSITVSGGRARAALDGDLRDYVPPEPPEGFWDNLFMAIRHEAEPKCPPAQVVRAMKLHEAAMESVERAGPVTI